MIEWIKPSPTHEMNLFLRILILAGLGACLSAEAGSLGVNPSVSVFAIGTNDFLLDGKRFQIRCGEVHAARVPKEYWRQPPSAWPRPWA